jgi:hypothetical protein
MIRSRRSSLIQPPCLAASLALAVALVTSPANGQYQVIAIGPPSFQSNSYPSLERQILGRLSLGGPYQPDDLPVLAQLTVLESIAMLADVHADLPYNLTGYQLEGQITTLGDLAQEFLGSVSSSPPDLTTLARAETVLSELETAYAEIDAAYGRFAGGLTERAAVHLRDIGRLTSAAGAVLRAAEGELLGAIPVPAERSPDFETLGTQARLLANEIVGLIGNVRSSKPQGSAWDSVARELAEVLSLVQSLVQALALQSTNKETAASFRAVSRRMSQVEARVALLGWPYDFDLAWRRARERLNVISDMLGLPRAISLAQRARANRPAPRPTPGKPAARIYRGPPQ